MKVEPLGESALILRELSRPAFEVAAAIEKAQLPGVLETVASYESVGIYFDPGQFDEDTLWELSLDVPLSVSLVHEIPVCYELGEDLESVSQQLGLSSLEVIELHTSKTYRCFAVGFCPGFPYLGYLPDALCGVPRRPAPRVRVEPGSVAITGRQTGIYPLERPGGWAIIGRTPLCVVDIEGAYFPVNAGDEVRFTSIGLSQFERLRGNRL